MIYLVSCKVLSCSSRFDLIWLIGVLHCIQDYFTYRYHIYDSRQDQVGTHDRGVESSPLTTGVGLLLEIYHNNHTDNEHIQYLNEFQLFISQIYRCHVLFVHHIIGQTSQGTQGTDYSVVRLLLFHCQEKMKTKKRNEINQNKNRYKKLSITFVPIWLA